MEENNAKELVLALERLERERNIKKAEVFKTIEDALVSALRKHMGKSAQIVANMDETTGQIKAFQVMNVVETVVNPETEISLEQAVKADPSATVGSTLSLALEINEFSRIAAQIAKQVLIQKIRDIERDNLYREYKPREGEVITGMVRRFSDKDIIVDIGKTEAIFPYCEQIRKERFPMGSRVKAVIAKVLSPKDFITVEDQSMARYRSAVSKMDKTQRGPYIILSRIAPLFLKKLFETEVPELEERIVEITAIERDPGFRAKVIVRTNDFKVDPIGACVGMRGMRIRAVTNELSGERIDLIAFSDDPQVMIANALSPAKVSQVKITDKEHKRAVAVVPDDQLAIALGKDWQNIKLASRLTGWEIEARSESQVQDAGKKAQADAINDLTTVEGIGPKLAELLIKAGITDIEKISKLQPSDLATLQGVGEKTAEKIIRGAQKYMSERAAGVKPAEVAEQPAGEANDDSRETN